MYNADLTTIYNVACKYNNVTLTPNLTDTPLSSPGADPAAPNAHFLNMRIEAMMKKLEAIVQFSPDDKAVMHELQQLKKQPKKSRKILSA